MSAVDLSAGDGYLMRLSSLAATNAELFFFLTEFSTLQRQYDPEAGFGPFHCVKAFFELGMSDKDCTAFVAACKHDPSVAYVLLRTAEYSFFDEGLFYEYLAEGTFPLRKALDHLRQFVKSFGTGYAADKLEAIVTEYEGSNGGNQETPSSAQSSGRTD